MRIITRDAIEAFEALRPFKRDNTEVRIDPVVNGLEPELYLFGNLIAKRFHHGELQITSAGWSSNTTKERLNGLPGVSISQRQGVWFLNAISWDGRWATVRPDGLWRYTEDARPTVNTVNQGTDMELPRDQQLRRVVDAYFKSGITDTAARTCLIEVGRPIINNDIQASAFLATCMISMQMGHLDAWLEHFAAHVDERHVATQH